MDAFTFSFRLKKNCSANMKMVEKISISHQPGRYYPGISACPAPRRKQIIAQPPMQLEKVSSFSSEIAFLESLATPYYFDDSTNSWLFGSIYSSQESVFAPAYSPLTRY